MIGELKTDIIKALDAELWTAALTSALALPDICGALASDEGRASGTHYRTWFAENLGDLYPLLPAEDAYQLRCSLLHQGRSSTRQYSRILFTPDIRTHTFHNNLLYGVLNLSIRQFSIDLAETAGRWYVDHFNDPNVRRNRKMLMRWHEEGFPPFITGVPVLT